MNKKGIYIFLGLLLCLSFCGQISSWDTKITYGYDGRPLSYNLFFSLSSGLGATDYLRIVWPQVLHTGTDKTKVLVTLISNENNYQITSVACSSYIVDANPVYFVRFNTDLDAGKWYQIQIYPNKANTLTYGLIQMESVSDIVTDYISYDQNFAFGYFYIHPISLTSTMTVSVSSTSTNRNRASGIYTTDIEVTPTKGSTSGGNFTVYLYNDGTGTNLLDFSFVGICQSAVPLSCPLCSAAVLNFCTISTDLSTITFSTTSITANVPIRITTQVQNPVYVATRGVKVYWVDFVSGIVVENGLHASSLTVSAINIVSPGSKRVQLFWGIEKGYTDADGYLSDMVIGIYKSAASSLVGPLNSFNNGFMISSTPPINSVFTVKMNIGALGVLQGSIVHNLPAAYGLSVYCSYTSPNIICQNVGAFIMANYRYFISAKAYFSSSLGATLSNFGDVSILSVVKDTSGNVISGVKLFNDLTTGETVPVVANTQSLDTGGWHSTSHAIGYSRIVSYSDDLTLSSTANAISGFFTGNKSTVGIVPNLQGSQQLLFLLRVPVSSMDSGVSNNTYTMKIMFNSKIIGFETGASNLGLDFVGYNSSIAGWSISSTPCYTDSAIVCEKYSNQAGNTLNFQTIVTSDNTSVYGIYVFNCGEKVNLTSYCGGNCKTHCQIFRGYSTTTQNGGIVSMRRVTFPTGYHSSLYADSNLLDFVISFYHAGSLVTTTLINAYTIEATNMANIKYAYVNYYDNSSIYNKGVRIPTLLRIGGGVLPTESKQATVVAVFFDQNMDANTFLTSPTTSYDIGCSTGQCLYYPNTGVVVPRDIWPCSDRIQFYNLPSIANQFNLLVPITQKLGNPPRSLTIAFLAQNYTVSNVTGLLRVLSVFRLFGPSVNNAVRSTTIGTLNGLSSSFSGTQLTNIDFTATSWAASGSFSYNINTSNIYDNPPNNTFLVGSNSVASAATYGSGSYGAGVTITSFNANIFASAVVKFNSPPNNTATTCSIFNYVYNEIQNPGANVERTGKYVYIAFCPIDDTFSLSSTAANIVFTYPQYPNTYVAGFPLSTALAYGYSNKIGLLQAYNLQTNSITSTRTCSTVKNQEYFPSSSKQRASFTLNFSQITMGPIPQGYPVLKLTLRIPQTTVPSAAALSISTSCDVSLSFLSCSVLMTNYTFYTITLTLSGTTVYSVRSLTFSLYADSSASFGAADLYTIIMYLPQSTSATALYYGSDFNTQATLCSCTSSFTVQLTGFGTVMTMNNFTYQSTGRSLRGKFGFNFGASSDRSFFYTTSYFEFNLGFLSTPNVDWKNKANFRCVVYNNGSSSISSLWKSLTLSTMPTIRLYPKSQINNPSSYLFNMVCYGGGMPNGTSTSSLTGNWYDSATSIQVATPILSSSVAFTNTASTFTPVLQSKRFNSDGSMAFYELKVTPTAALDQNSRIYVEFPYAIPADLNREKFLECYTRITNTNKDTEATFTYCDFIGEKRIVVWNNRVITAGSDLYVDIFGVSQPKASNIVSGQSVISVSIDTDIDYSNGVSIYGQVNDNTPTGAPTGVIVINSATMSSSYIRTVQDITVNFEFPTTGKITAGKKLYFVFPSTYGIWVSRGSTLTTTNCLLNADGSTTNLATDCTYISSRIITITSNVDSGKKYTATFKGIMASPYLPPDITNNIRFYIYLASADQTSITDYSYEDKSTPLSLVRNQDLIDLSWISYNATQSGSSLSLTQVSSAIVEVYIGYFSKITEIRQKIYPSNFKSGLSFTINNQVAEDFPIIPSNQINLGYSSQFIRIAASSSVTTGLYKLKFTKGGDTNNYYTEFPPLVLIVQNTKCSLKASQGSYTIPLNGYSLPIVISAFRCIPITGINISFTANSSQLSLVSELSNTQLLQNDQDGQIYLVFKHTQATLVAGNTISVSFSITGTDADSYGTIPSIVLTLIAQNLISKPLATALTTPTQSLGTATFRLQCSAPSTIYWGLGIFPSILNTGALGFQDRIISTGNGLQTNFTQPMDFYWKVYGVEYASIANMQITKTVYGLKSNSPYLFRYFCVNQLEQISDAQMTSFTSTDNGAYLMKILMTFNGKITYGQFNNLACSLAENFVIPYSRVYTQAVSYCGNTSTIFYADLSSPMLAAANTNNQYIYNFYIIPDYTLSRDLTNLNIRQLLSQQTFSTQIITTTTNFIDLPVLIQMQTEDVQNLGSPTYSVRSVTAGLNSIVCNATVTNMNGFAVFAVMNGEFLSNMTLPTAQNIKQGLFDVNTSLRTVQIQYMPQKYNVSFQFSDLSPNTTYWLFHFATVDDPTLTTLSTAVTSVKVTTLATSDIQVISSFKAIFTFGLAILVLIIS